MTIDTSLSTLDTLLAFSGRLILLNIALLVLIITGWVCAAVAIDAVKDLERRSIK